MKVEDLSYEGSLIQPPTFIVINETSFSQVETSWINIKRFSIQSKPNLLVKLLFFTPFWFIVYPAIMKSIVDTKVGGWWEGVLMMFAVGKSMENCGEFTQKL